MNNPLDVTSFLNIAISLTELVGRLHQTYEFSRTLSPDHLFYHPKTGQFELVDVPTGLSGDATSSYAYMSPEQTGRMKRTVDGRSHLYVLGVIYYELLTGHLPFRANTAAEWVYAHMAILPEPLSATQAAVPGMICDIVMKLLSKPVENRYQSPYGISLDLKRCLREWRHTGSVEPFVPEQAYAQSQFQIPQTLYGRKKEMEKLFSALEWVRSGRMELKLITGEAGCGKTMMVREFQMEVFKQRGYFIAGKFDQFMRDIPYMPFIQAFQNLIRQLLAESPERIAHLRTKLLKALGQSGAVVAELIPEVAFITGKLPPVEALPPADATRRLQQLFLNFVRVFADSGEYPLVLFLDDLQWADLASLRFLRVLLNGARSWNLLLIGAYRDNEIHKNHPLQKLLEEELINLDSVSYRVNMTAFNLPETYLFVAETLHREPGECRILAETLFQKTAGNPYYLTQMLQSLYHDRLIYFNGESIRCGWDLEAIKKKEGSSDVLQLIVERFDKLPERTRSVLRMAACIGNAFPLSLLSTVFEQSVQQTGLDLSAALYEGLVLISNDHETIYTFLHDRVQQAIYHLLSETETKENHLAIGRILLQQGRLEQTDDFLLETVYHLNQGSELVAVPTEQRELAEINLRAGRKAKGSSAYDTALILLKAGIKLMQNEAWSSEDSLYFDLWLERSECEYYCGNFVQAEEILDLLKEHARNLLDWTNIYVIQIAMYAYRNQHDKAMEIGIHAMAEFGLTIPLKPTLVSIARELLRMWRGLKGITDPFTNPPETQDPRHKLLSRIVTATAPSISIVNPQLSFILFSKYIRLELKNGGSEFFPLTLSTYALMLCLGFGKYKAGLRLVERALPYIEELNSVFMKGRILQIIGMILVLNRPQDARSYFKRGAAYSLESGDLLFSGYGVSLHVVNYIGDLREIYPLCIHYVETASRNLDPVTERMLQKTMEYVRTLQATMVGPLDDFTQEDNLFPEINLWTRNHYYYCYTCEIEVRYVFGHYADAIELVKRSEKWEDKNIGNNHAAKQCYYAFLATTAHYASIPGKDRKKTLKNLGRRLRRMNKWTKTAYEGTMHKYLLMSAEMARLAGKHKQAVKLYDQAVKSAKENGIGLLQYEAIACELAARYYLSQGEEKAAEGYIRDACRGYLKWGAIGKVKRIRRRRLH
jgi:predicted ATPase